MVKTVKFVLKWWLMVKKIKFFFKIVFFYFDVLDHQELGLGGKKCFWTFPDPGRPCRWSWSGWGTNFFFLEIDVLGY
jgi:hypothetical protein